MVSGNSIRPLASFLVGTATAAALIVLFLQPSSNSSIHSTASEIDDLKVAPVLVTPQTLLGAADHKSSTAEENVLSSYEEIESFEGLEEMLQKAAMADRTVIMTAINQAWSEPGSLFDLFLESFRIGDDIGRFLKNMIIIAMDPKAFTRCQSVHPYCFFLRIKGINFSDEQPTGKKEYFQLMWSRNNFQRRILELGYNFLFTDVDIIWFRNPLPHISAATDLAIACDYYIGNPDDLHNWANGGFLYAKSSAKTIEFFKIWQAAKANFPDDYHEQRVFENIKHELVPNLGVKVQFLDTLYIGGMCQPKKAFDVLCTFHATCRVGLDSKLQSLREVLSEWKNYRGIA